MNEVIESILRNDQPRLDSSSQNIKDLVIDRFSLLNDLIRSKADVVLTAAGTTLKIFNTYILIYVFGQALLLRIVPHCCNLSLYYPQMIIRLLLRFY